METTVTSADAFLLRSSQTVLTHCEHLLAQADLNEVERERLRRVLAATEADLARLIKDGQAGGN
jgi:hypothetical protein